MSITHLHQRARARREPDAHTLHAALRALAGTCRVGPLVGPSRPREPGDETGAGDVVEEQVQGAAGSALAGQALVDGRPQISATATPDQLLQATSVRLGTYVLDRSQIADADPGPGRIDHLRSSARVEGDCVAG